MSGLRDVAVPSRQNRPLKAGDVLILVRRRGKIFEAVIRALKELGDPRVAVAGAVALMTGLYLVFPLFKGFALTQATIAWGALRIVPCFALGCALHALWRARPAQNRLAAVVASAASVAVVLTLAAFGAPDALIVTGLGAVIFFLARTAQTGGEVLNQGPLVYLGEISYSVYMVCVPWKIVFVKAASKVLQLNDEHLPLWLWLVFLGSVVPLAAASYHLIEKPARSRMKLMADSWESRRPSAAKA